MRPGAAEVTELALQAPLVLPADGAVQVQVVVGGALDAGERGRWRCSPARPGRARARNSPWTCHARGLLAPAGQTGAQAGAQEMAVWPPADAVPVGLDGFYEELAAAGLGYGGGVPGGAGGVAAGG